MNHVILLAGGVGSRVGGNVPKQYLEIGGQPVFMYSFLRFACHDQIDSIVLVTDNQWRPFVESCINGKTHGKKIIFAPAGCSRQRSVLNGLNALSGYASSEDVTLVHDSVRPLFDVALIHEEIEKCKDYDGALPVVNTKDTTIVSEDGDLMTGILKRDSLYSAQSPETFKYGKFLAAHNKISMDELDKIRGGSELAFKTGMRVGLIHSSDINFKITTALDLKLFEILVQEQK